MQFRRDMIFVVEAAVSATVSYRRITNLFIIQFDVKAFSNQIDKKIYNKSEIMILGHHYRKRDFIKSKNMETVK